MYIYTCVYVYRYMYICMRGLDMLRKAASRAGLSFTEACSDGMIRLTEREREIYM